MFTIFVSMVLIKFCFRIHLLSLYHYNHNGSLWIQGSAFYHVNTNISVIWYISWLPFAGKTLVERRNVTGRGCDFWLKDSIFLFLFLFLAIASNHFYQNVPYTMQNNLAGHTNFAKLMCQNETIKWFYNPAITMNTTFLYLFIFP